jgi:tetratricopeptide (TPR) repeat protein
MVLSQGISAIAAPKESPAPSHGAAPSGDGAGAPDSKSKSEVTNALRESSKSAESSASAFKESAKAARALLDAAKAEEAIIQQAEKAAVEKMEKKAAADKAATDKPMAAKPAPQTASKPEAAPVVKAEAQKQEEPPKISKAPEATEAPNPAKQSHAPAPQPEAVATKSETSAPAPAPVAPAAPAAPTVPPAAGAVPQDAAAAASALTAPAEGEAPKKRKSRFGSSSADLFGDDGKKGKKPKEPAIPLTPEQVKASEIKAFCDKARAAIRKGDDVLAEGFLVSLISVDLPDSEKKGALQEVAGIYEEKGDMTKAIAIYEKLCSVLDKDLDTSSWLLKLGQLYRDAGAYQMAVSRYYAVIQLGMKMGTTDFERSQKATREAQREIANTYFVKGDFEQAQKFYNMALRSDLSKEERAVAMFRSAHCTFMRNDMNGATNALERFLKDFSKHPAAAEARYMLASAYKTLGRPQDAYDTVIDLLRSAKDKSEADPKAWSFWQKKAGNEFANDYYQRADFVNAVTLYQALAALENAPEWRWPVVYQMGLCFERLRLEPRALECFRFIVDEDKKPEFRSKKMPQSVGNLVKMAGWRVEQLAWEGSTNSQLRTTAGGEVIKNIPR